MAWNRPVGAGYFTRLMQAGRISLTIGLASMLLSVILGALLGAMLVLSRVVDHLIMRVADVLMSIPDYRYLL